MTGVPRARREGSPNAADPQAGVQTWPDGVIATDGQAEVHADQGVQGDTVDPGQPR